MKLTTILLISFVLAAGRSFGGHSSEPDNDVLGSDPQAQPGTTLLSREGLLQQRMKQVFPNEKDLFEAAFASDDPDVADKALETIAREQRPGAFDPGHGVDLFAALRDRNETFDELKNFFTDKKNQLVDEKAALARLEAFRAEKDSTPLSSEERELAAAAIARKLGRLPPKSATALTNLDALPAIHERERMNELKTYLTSLPPVSIPAPVASSAPAAEAPSAPAAVSPPTLPIKSPPTPVGLIDIPAPIVVDSSNTPLGSCGIGGCSSSLGYNAPMMPVPQVYYPQGMPAPQIYPPGQPYFSGQSFPQPNRRRNLRIFGNRR